MSVIKLRKSSRKILNMQIKACKWCEPHNKGTTIGEGNINSPIMIIKQSNKESSEKYLNLLIKKTHVARQRLFVTNLAHCSPTKYNNRVKCLFYLKAEIELINPLLIIGIGKHIRDALLPYSQLYIPYRSVNGVYQGRHLLFTEKLHDINKDRRSRLFKDIIKVMRRFV